MMFAMLQAADIAQKIEAASLVEFPLSITAVCIDIVQKNLDQIPSRKRLSPVPAVGSSVQQCIPWK